MIKKCLFLIFTMASLLCGCSRKNSISKAATMQDLKVGFIYSGKINDKGSVQAQDAGRIALERKGVRTMYVENVPEDALCGTVIKELIRQGCKMIFATSSGYEKYVLEVALDYPDVKFSCFYGNNIKENVSSYAGRTYEARYLAGIVAGLKTTANKIGYVAAYSTPEYIRDINAFALGVRSVNPDAFVYVRWTDSTDNKQEAKYRADELMILGCDVLTQHLDSTSIYSVAMDRGVHIICNNYPAPEFAQDSYLTTVCSNWGGYVIEEVQNFLEGSWNSRFYLEGLSSDTVDLSELSVHCDAGTKNAVENAKRKIISGELNIFTGPINDNNIEPNEMVGYGGVLDVQDIWNMDWFVEGVRLSLY